MKYENIHIIYFTQLHPYYSYFTKEISAFIDIYVLTYYVIEEYESSENQ